MDARRWALTVAVVAVASSGVPATAEAHHGSLGGYIDRGFRAWEPEINHCNAVSAHWRDAAPGVYGWARIRACSFNLNRRLLRELHSTPGLLCTVVIHEMGHLAGYGDVNNPQSIMHYRHERGRVSAVC